MGKLNPDDYEIPELKKPQYSIESDTDPIDSLKININQFNNIKNVNLSDSLDFNKISSIQNDLLSRLRDQIKLNLVDDEEAKKLRVAYKKVPIVIKNNDEPFVYSKKYN